MVVIKHDIPLFLAVEFDASQIKNFILNLSIRANTLQIGVTGLPFSGKSTLLCSMLELKSQAEYAKFSLGEESGLKLCKAIVLKDTVNSVSQWIPSTKEDAEFFSISAALAQACIKSQKFPNLISMSDITGREIGLVFSHPDLDKPFCAILDKLRVLMMSLETKGVLHTLMTGSLTFVNIWDAGVNKAVLEVLPILARKLHYRNLLLLDVFSLATDAAPDQLYKPPQLGNETLYRNRYTARGDDSLMNHQTSLNSLVQNIAVANDEDSALLVGTNADQLTKEDLKVTKARVMHSIQGRADEVGVADVICSRMVTVDGRDPKDASKVRAALERLIERNNRFENEIKLSWIFLRCILLCTKKLFMTKGEVLEISHRCGLENQQEMEAWIDLFQSCGSIICLQRRGSPTPQDFIILNPLVFFQELDKLYYIDPQKDVTAELWGDVETTREGILSRNLAQHLWGDREDCPSFFLQVLQSLGVIVKVDEILKEASGSCYFMPSLRSKHFQSHLSSDCSSLLITTSKEVPLHKQTEFILRLKRDYKHQNQIVFVPQKCCNVLQFDWVDQEVSANIHIRFIGEVTEVAIKVTLSQLPTDSIAEAKLFSVFKSTCIDVFQEAMKDTQYDLGVACPNASHSFHVINFHPLQQDTHLFCSICQAMVEVTGERALWIMAAYQV